MDKISEVVVKAFWQVISCLYENENNEPQILIRVWYELKGFSISSLPYLSYCYDRLGIIEKEEFKNKSDYQDYICKDVESENWNVVIHIKVNEKNSRFSILKYLIKNFYHAIIDKIYFLLNAGEHLDHDYIRNRIYNSFEENNLISLSIYEFFFFIFNMDLNTITLLSSQKYEGVNANGKIYKSMNGTDRGKRKNTGIKIKFSDNIPFDVNNIRHIRKLLEISNSELGLIVNNKNKAVGYGYDNDKKHYECTVSILGHLWWEISFNNFYVKYFNGTYKIPSHKINSHFDYKEFFKLDNSDKIECVIDKVSEQEHGTLLIISNPSTSENEARRLCQKYQRGLYICPTNLHNNINIVKELASIDGAIIMDTNCKCYAIGVI